LISSIEQRIKRFVNWEEADLPNIERRPLAWVRQLVKRSLFFFRPNALIRYRPVISYLKATGAEKILEVGSGSIGITRFLRQEVTGVDLDFAGPRTSYLRPTKGSAASLPFDNNTFDSAISLDVLEHVPKPEREQMIAEMIRVSKESVIIAAPCGEAPAAWETRLRDTIDRRISRWANQEKKKAILFRSDFLKDHQSKGLPSYQEVLQAFEDLAAKSAVPMRITAIDNEPCWLWYILALGSIRISNFFWILTTVVGTILMPIITRIKFGDPYRKIFIIEKCKLDGADETSAAGCGIRGQES